MSGTKIKENDVKGENTGFGEKLRRLNELVDRKSKEMKLADIILPFVLYFVFFLVFESAFAFVKYYVGNGIADWFTLTNVSVWAVIFLSALLWIMPKIMQLILFPLSAVLWTVYAVAQLCVYKSNGSMFRIANVVTAKNAVQFAGSVVKGLPIGLWIGIVCLVAVAAVFEIIIAKKAVFPEKSRLRLVKTVGGAVLCIACLSAVLLHVPKDSLSHLSYIYKNFTDNETVYISSDFYTYCAQDVKNMVMKKIYVKENLEKIDSYFESKPQHTDNEMTGIFQGKNLLVIQLESFEDRLLTEELCPYLTKIKSESIVFENYYGMRFGPEPTIGNEVAVNLGWYMTSDFSASGNLGDLHFPYSLANTFARYGYTPNSFHQNNASFYNRDVCEPAFGYEKYNCLRDMTDEELLFEDDSVLASCDELYEAFTGGDKIMNYFIGYTAHPPYVTEDVYSGLPNDLYYEAISRHPGLINEQDPDQDEIYKIFATLTDDMAGELIQRMEEDGTLDNTVILFVADHANVSDLADSSGAEYVRVQNIPCFIYCKGVKPQTVEKVCSNVDILPTILNMFGMENNNSYLGSDIFDPNYEGIAYLPTLSWVTNKCICVDGSVAENFTDEEISEEYIEKMNEFVQNSVEVNNLVMYTDYFKDSE